MLISQYPLSLKCVFWDWLLPVNGCFAVLKNRKLLAYYEMNIGMTANVVDFISKSMEVLCNFFFFNLYLIIRELPFYLYKHTITEYENSTTEFCTCLFCDKQCRGIWQLHDKSLDICRRRSRVPGRVGWFNFFSPLAATGILTFFLPPLSSVILSFFHFQKVIYHCLFAFMTVCCWPFTSHVNGMLGCRVCAFFNT